jgi:hypothetical protein
MTHTEIENSENPNELRHELFRLRQGLWDCFAASGGDTDGDKTPAALTTDIVQLAISSIEDLRVSYDEADVQLGDESFRRED